MCDIVEVSVQIASDLHLEHVDAETILKLFNEEFRNNFFGKIINPSAEILVLAGDIGLPSSSIYRMFIGWCSEKFNQVLLVSGNHEYFNQTLDTDQIDALISNICYSYGNVIYMQKKVFIYRDIVFLGCTMWSNILPEAETEVLRHMNDYRKIKHFTIEKSRNLHNNHRQWLQEQLERFSSNELTKVVITHHPMVEDTVCKTKKVTDCAFQTNLNNMLKNVDLHIAGHTHRNRDIKIDNFDYVVNCKGYGIPGSVDYDNAKVKTLYCCK